TMDRPQPRPAAEAAAGYRLVRQRIDTLLRGRAEVAELVVPACPSWTVRQTVSHLCGVAQDLIAGNIQGAGTEPWTWAQVLRLAERKLNDLLNLWAEKTDEVTALLPRGSDLAANQLVFDALTHEHDLRGALGEPAAAPAQLALQLSGFEAPRALGGRRLVSQILSLPWRGDATALLAMFMEKAVHPPEVDLIE
ncbi:MAG: hypothetical protein ACRDQX_13285, partial [Pseudonocardiaceae bacterium]